VTQRKPRPFETTLYKGRPAIVLRTGVMEMTVLLGGGHIASVVHRDRPVNPLWEPPWPTVEPAARRLGATEIYGEEAEGQLLSSISGHNLCLDVFGEHSPGEQESGLTFHGEAGMVTWEVTEVEDASPECRLTLRAELPRTALTVERVFHCRGGASQITVETRVTNRVGFERALGCAEHVTLGVAFLSPAPTLFASNADRGITWPDPDNVTDDAFADFQEFAYPQVPLRGGGEIDWRQYPRSDVNSDCCTLRILPQDPWAWFVAAHNPSQVALAYVWEREAFPWLMTWEENHFRSDPPWNSRTLTRGLEFTSYAFALGRRQNVEMGTLLETPTHAWLDANETRSTRFVVALHPYDEPLEAAPELAPDGEAALHAGSHGWTIDL
jgi:hypothetical protein